MGGNTPQWPVVNPSPVTPDPNFAVGLCYAPFTDEEWDHLQWVPVYRVHLDQAPILAARQASFMAVVDLLDKDGKWIADDNLDALMPSLLSGPWAVGLEDGNEPSFKGALSPDQMNAWHLRAYKKLRDAGFTGHIVTAGTANINDDTLNSAYQSIKNLPPDMVFGWHAYDAWQNQIDALRRMLNGRAHFMTETGIRAAGQTEEAVAAQAADYLTRVRNSGAGLGFWYQAHDGPPGTQDCDFGLRAWNVETNTFEGRWRLIEQSVKGFSAP